MKYLAGTMALLACAIAFCALRYADRQESGVQLNAALPNTPSSSALAFESASQRTDLGEPRGDYPSTEAVAKELPRGSLIVSRSVASSPQTSKTPSRRSEALSLTELLDTSNFEVQVQHIEARLAGDNSSSREDLLAMYGHSAAARGRFDRAAAAYIMFLNEFGTEHEYSERIAMRLADSLAPLDLDSSAVAHKTAGPVFQPKWRRNRAASPRRLRLAVPAYKLAADIAEDARSRSIALFKIGWVYRALSDWEASTVAWDRCAEQVSGTKEAVRARWLASENLEWTGYPKAAAERMRAFLSEYPEHLHAPAARRRIEALAAVENEEDSK